MKRNRINENIDINKVVPNFNDLDSFILSFARLPQERLLAIAEKYGDNVKGLMLKIMSTDPGQYELKRNGEIVPRTDATILKLVKSYDLNEDFERLYNAMLTKAVGGAINKQQRPDREDVVAAPAPTPDTNEAKTKITEQDEHVPDVPVDGEVRGTEAIKVIEQYDEDGQTVYCVVCENIGEVSVDDLSELESNVCDVVGCDCGSCEFEYETINGAFISSDSSELFDAVETGQLSGLIKVYAVSEIEASEITDTDKQKQISDFVNKIALTPSMPMGSICNIYYIICNKNMPNECVDYNEFRAIGKMRDEMLLALKRSPKSVSKIYEALRKERYIK
jgi:hypothetical protein